MNMRCRGELDCLVPNIIWIAIWIIADSKPNALYGVQVQLYNCTISVDMGGHCPKSAKEGPISTRTADPLWRDELDSVQTVYLYGVLRSR